MQWQAVKNKLLASNALKALIYTGFSDVEML
jgi:hypothetical protein